MKKNLFNDPMSLSIFYISVLVFVLSLQGLIILVCVYQFIPMTMDPITAGVPAKLLKLFHPNRNHFFYHAFIALAITGQAVALCVYRRRLGDAWLSQKIRSFLIAEIILVSWQLLAVFKILQYGNPLWARLFLYAGFILALLVKIFWPELKRSWGLLMPKLRGKIPSTWGYIADGVLIVLLFLTIMIPDTQKGIVRFALADSNNHFDQWLMAPLWAYHQGLKIAVQFYEPLNAGVLVLIQALANLLGGLNYAHVLTAVCLLAVIYYSAFYYFFRRWLGILPAIFAVLLAVKLQMFHMGINPLVWIYPDKSMLRHILDVAVFWGLMSYARGKGESLLWLASVMIGVSMAYVFDTGIYLLMGFYAYVALILSFKETRLHLCPDAAAWRKVLGLVFLPWALMVLTMLLCFGSVVLHKEFWIMSLQDLPRWIRGEDSISIFSCLKDRNFFAFFAAFAPPIIYALSISETINKVQRKQWGKEKLLIVPLAVYGLGVYAHFIWQSQINDYYMVPLPLVACVCFWGVEFLNRFNVFVQRLIKFIFVLLAMIGLCTNFLFTYYPNVFNMAQENWEAEKLAYQSNFNFSQDAQFVHDATKDTERVPLISGFATQILMQANRSPFFYESMTLLNETDINNLVGQLDSEAPAQVFVDKKIVNVPGLQICMQYLMLHYQYAGEQSDHLILLKRGHG